MHFLVAAIVSIPLAAIAQDGHATVKGVVTDVTGARVPFATVVLQNDQDRFTAGSDREGVYEFSNVPPASYAVRVSFSGFKTSQMHFVLSDGEFRSDRVQLVVAGTGCGPTECCVVVSELTADRAITGTVTNARGRTLPGATISVYTIASPPQRTMAAPDGSFAFKNMSCGPLLVTIDAAHYVGIEWEIPAYGCLPANRNVTLAAAQP